MADSTAGKAEGTPSASTSTSYLDGTKPAVTPEQRTPAAPVKTGAAPSTPETHVAPGTADPPKSDDKAASAAGVDDDKELIKLTPAALNERLRRASKTQLKDNFGTESIDEIKAQLAELRDRKEKDEETRRAALANEERLAEDLRKEREAREDAERTLSHERDRRVIGKEHKRLERIAKAHVNPDLLDESLGRLRKHLRKMDEGELAKVSDTDIAKFFTDLADRKPTFAKVAKVDKKDDKAADKKDDKAPPKGAVTNGADTRSRPTGNANPEEKTARPNQPNSMTKKEIRDRGYSW
jgi:hypothetical protein